VTLIGGWRSHVPARSCQPWSVSLPRASSSTTRMVHALSARVQPGAAPGKDSSVQPLPTRQPPSGAIVPRGCVARRGPVTGQHQPRDVRDSLPAQQLRFRGGTRLPSRDLKPRCPRRATQAAAEQACGFQQAGRQRRLGVGRIFEEAEARQSRSPGSGPGGFPSVP